MAVFEIEANGTTYEVEAADIQSALSALGSIKPPAGSQDTAPPLSANGMPEGMVLNPGTGQVVDMRSPNNPYVQEGGGRAVMQGLGQGLGFGGMDEVVAGAYGLTGPGKVQENYDFAKASMDEELRRAREQHPVAAIGGEVVGGVASGLAATGGIAPAASLKAKLAQAMGVGGATGAVYGGLAAEGGAGQRAKGAIKGGAIGGAAGAASVPIAWAAGKGASVVGGAAANLSRKAKPQRVNAAIAKAIESSGRKGSDAAAELAAAAREGQGMFAVADALGMPGQRALSGTARLGGAARKEVTDFLEDRQQGQGDRIGAMLSDALGKKPKPPGTGLIPWSPMTAAEEATAVARAATASSRKGVLTTAEKLRASMTKTRGDTANKAYDTARKTAQPVDVRGALGAIDDRIGPMQGSGIKGDGIDAKLASYRARLAANNPAKASPKGGSGLAPEGYDAAPLSVELSDFDRVLGVKQAVQDDIGAAVRAGRNNEARELGKIVSALDEALESASPDYRAANDGFRKASREIDQIDAGQAATSPGSRAADTVDEFGRLTAPEQEAYRAGYGDRLMARIEAAASGVDKSRPFTSGKSAEELAALVQDPAALSRGLGRERTMFETRRQATGGSQTADNLADMQGITGLVRRAPRGLMDAVMTGTEWVGRMAQGQNDATRTALAKALLASGQEGADVLAKAVQRGEQLTQQQQLAMQTILYLQENSGLQVAR